jgi:hypothetical protein
MCRNVYVNIFKDWMQATQKNIKRKFVTDSMTDLHIHTTASDGQYTPSQIIAMAKDKGITCLSITDHDTVAGIAEGAEAARQAGIDFIPGIEISVQGHRELHILGYHIDPHNHALVAMCSEFAENRAKRGERILDYLQGYGITLALEQVLVHTKNGLLGRPHFARALVEAGYVGTTREAFDRYLGTPAFDAIERPKPSFAEGIKIIANAGGLAVLAHPALLKLDDHALETLLRELIENGLGGIEAFYSTHTQAQTGFYLSLCEKYRLTVTGGSDFHGEKVKPDIPLGIRAALSFWPPTS